jgi:hypothetical protein
VFAHRRSLDRMIVEGRVAEPGSALAERIRQVTRRRHQRHVASSLRSMVQHAEQPGPGLSPVLIDRLEVTAGPEAILGLAERLDGLQPVNARGMVLAARFLNAGPHSACYDGVSSRSIVQAIWEISDALSDPPTPGHDQSAIG